MRGIPSIFSALCALLLLPLGSATAAPSLADYGALPAISLMALSPDGTRIAYRTVQGDRELVVVYSLTEHKRLQAVDIGAVTAHRLRFVRNDDVIVVASEYQRLRGYGGALEARDYSTAFRLDVASGAITQLLTPGEVIYMNQTGLGEIVAVSEDRESLYMPAFVGDESHRGQPELALLRVSLTNRARPRIVVEGRRGARDYFMNADDTVIAQEILLGEHHEIQARDADGRWRTIYQHDGPLPDISVAGVAPGGDALIVLDEDAQERHRTYYRMSLQDGALSEAELQRADRDIEAVLTDDDQQVFGVRYSGFNPSYALFDADRDRRMQAIVDAFPEHSVRLVDWTPDWKAIVVHVSGSQIAGDYYLVDERLQAHFLASDRPGIDAADINPIGRVTFTAEDGLPIPTLLTIPRDRVESMHNLPAVMMPHGGPEAYDRIGFDFFAQALASRGYLVIQPQFRGSSGFGYAHRDAGRGEWGGKMQSDLTDALTFLAGKGIVDPQRVCIVGASYGGYAALAGGAFTPDRYRCVVSLAGIGDLDDILSDERPVHGRHSWVTAYWQDRVAAGSASREFLARISPINAVERFSAPVLLMHGTQDSVIPIRQSERMARALGRAGKDVRFVSLDGENHWLLGGPTRAQAVETIVEFVDAHLTATPTLETSAASE